MWIGCELSLIKVCGRIILICESLTRLRLGCRKHTPINQIQLKFDWSIRYVGDVLWLRRWMYVFFYLIIIDQRRLWPTCAHAQGSVQPRKTRPCLTERLLPAKFCSIVEIIDQRMSKDRRPNCRLWCLFVWLFAISEELIDEKCYLVIIRVKLSLSVWPIGKRHGNTFAM